MYENFVVIEGEGLPDEKVCDMFLKWRLIPQEYRVQLCPKPTEEQQTNSKKKATTSWGMKKQKKQTRICV